MENKTAGPIPEQKNWIRRHPLYSIVIVLALLLFISNLNNQPSPSSQVQTIDSDTLKAKVQTNSSGVFVTNLETIDWNDCMFGLNGSNGFGFDNPPYQTRNDLSITHAQPAFIPFSDITLADGTKFNPLTHAVNSLVLVCFRHDHERDWLGH